MHEPLEENTVVMHSKCSNANKLALLSRWKASLFRMSTYYGGTAVTAEAVKLNQPLKINILPFSFLAINYE